MGWLILAAGRSQRFNGDKLLSRIPDAAGTLIELCAEKYIAHDAPVLVVTRANHLKLHALLRARNIDFTICPDSDCGMSASLSWGVREVAGKWPWVGVVLADMVLIQQKTIEHLASYVNQNNIVLPVFTEPNIQSGNIGRSFVVSTLQKKVQQGHPVLFGRVYYKHLLGLNGDLGAKSIVQKYSQNVVTVHTEDPGIVFDIDTRCDMAKLLPLLSLANH